MAWGEGRGHGGTPECLEVRLICQVTGICFAGFVRRFDPWLADGQVRAARCGRRERAPLCEQLIERRRLLLHGRQDV
jgi:hypothetical protein